MECSTTPCSGSVLTTCAGGVRASSLLNTLIYMVLGREEVSVLRDVRGGDRLRLTCLVQGLGVKLVGRQGLEPEGVQLLLDMLR